MIDCEEVCGETAVNLSRGSGAGELCAELSSEDFGNVLVHMRSFGEDDGPSLGLVSGYYSQSSCVAARDSDKDLGFSYPEGLSDPDGVNVKVGEILVHNDFGLLWGGHRFGTRRSDLNSLQPIAP
jgi:hypothetical protein